MRSTLDYDRTEKKSLYARAGIAEYWVIDIDGKRVHCFRQPAGEDYRESWTIDRGEIIPLAFPDICVSIERFWAKN